MTGASGNAYLGLHEFFDMALVCHYLDSGDYFFDVGSNIGSYTIIASKLRRAKVIAVEPVPATLNRLRRNICANEVEPLVEVVPCAVGSEPGEVWFTSDQDTINKVVAQDFPGEKIRVEVSTLDVIANGRVPAVAKLDVEGYELEALKGANGLLSSQELKILLVEDNSPLVRSLISSYGFHECYYDPFLRRLSSERTEKCLFNHIWVRDIASVQARLAASPKINVLGQQL